MICRASRVGALYKKALMNTQSKNNTKRDERRLARDNKTVMAMAQLYCHDHHRGLRGENRLCAECYEVVDYAMQRTRNCPHLHKGICEACEIQCYRPSMRASIRTIMAYSGPRMILHHPLMAIRHIVKKITLKSDIK